MRRNECRRNAADDKVQLTFLQRWKQQLRGALDDVNDDVRLRLTDAPDRGPSVASFPGP